MSISEFQKQLILAQDRLDEVLSSRAGHRDILTAYDDVALAQRTLAAAKGEEYATPYDIGFEPEAAVSTPVLLQTDDAAILTFKAMCPMKDGTREDAGWGIVELYSSQLTKSGCPNDEALPG